MHPDHLYDFNKSLGLSWLNLCYNYVPLTPPKASYRRWAIRGIRRTLGSIKWSVCSQSMSRLAYLVSYIACVIAGLYLCYKQVPLTPPHAAYRRWAIRGLRSKFEGQLVYMFMDNQRPDEIFEFIKCLDDSRMEVCDKQVPLTSPNALYCSLSIQGIPTAGNLVLPSVNMRLPAQDTPCITHIHISSTNYISLMLETCSLYA